MNKIEFLKQLEIKLGSINNAELSAIIEYYDGYIEEAKDFELEEVVINNLGSIDDLVDEILEGLRNENIDTETYSLSVVEDNVNKLDVDVKGTNIIIEYDDTISSISIKVNKQYKQDYIINTADNMIMVKQIRKESYLKNIILGDFSANVRKMYIRIPVKFYGDINIVSSNGSITFMNDNEDINQNIISLKTSNSSIKATKIKCNNLTLVTSNSSIKVEDVQCTEGYFKTSNSKITLIDIKAKEYDAITSNAKVMVINNDCPYTTIKTSNARVEIVNNQNMGKIKYHTSNSAVVINGNKQNTSDGIFQYNDDQLILDITTSNGKIEIH